MRARNVPYPLQLSQRKGRRSSCRQKGIWQWAPIASTSPVDILLKDSFGLVFCEVIVGGGFGGGDDIGRLWRYAMYAE